MCTHSHHTCDMSSQNITFNHTSKYRISIYAPKNLKYRINLHTCKGKFKMSCTYFIRIRHTRTRQNIIFTLTKTTKSYLRKLLFTCTIKKIENYAK